MNLYDELCRATGKPKKPRRKTPKKDLEAIVVRDCLAYLHGHPDVIYVERRNTGMILFQSGGCVRFGHKGAADIWCLLRRLPPWRFNCPDATAWVKAGQNLHIEIECKRADGKGKQTQAQAAFQEFCVNNAIPYLLVTSAKELAEKLLQFGA